MSARNVNENWVQSMPFDAVQRSSAAAGAQLEIDHLDHKEYHSQDMSRALFQGTARGNQFCSLFVLRLGRS